MHNESLTSKYKLSFSNSYSILIVLIIFASFYYWYDIRQQKNKNNNNKYGLLLAIYRATRSSFDSSLAASLSLYYDKTNSRLLHAAQLSLYHDKTTLYLKYVL